MSAAPAANLAPPEGGLSQPGRIVNTFIAPSKTFTDLRRSGSWWMPWLLISVVSVLFVFTLDKKVGYEQVLRTAISRSSRAAQFESAPAAQQGQQIKSMARFYRVLGYASPAVILVVYVLIAAVLLGTLKLGTGTDLPFNRTLAIVIYGQLPAAIWTVLAIVSLLAGANPDAFNIQNPVASNPGYFMNQAASPFFYGLASALDVFIIWTIVLMAIGFARNSRLRFSATLAIVASWYVLYKLVASGLGAIFS